MGNTTSSEMADHKEDQKQDQSETLFKQQYPGVSFDALTRQNPCIRTNDGRTHWLDKSTNTMYSYCWISGRHEWTMKPYDASRYSMMFEDVSNDN